MWHSQLSLFVFTAKSIVLALTLYWARVCGVPVSWHSGGLLATTFVVTVNIIATTPTQPQLNSTTRAIEINIVFFLFLPFSFLSSGSELLLGQMSVGRSVCGNFLLGLCGEIYHICMKKRYHKCPFVQVGTSPLIWPCSQRRNPSVVLNWHLLDQCWSSFPNFITFTCSILRFILYLLICPNPMQHLNWTLETFPLTVGLA